MVDVVTLDAGLEVRVGIEDAGHRVQHRLAAWLDPGSVDVEEDLVGDDYRVTLDEGQDPAAVRVPILIVRAGAELGLERALVVRVSDALALAVGVGLRAPVVVL
ncbi:MAG: hypothetical protein ABL982_21725 [Vicinamibacterales bacterium]